MLQKTMMAFGKAKPKFNNNSKMKKGQMELFDSCSSFDFECEVTEVNSDDRIVESDDVKSDSERIIQDDVKSDMTVHESSMTIKLQNSVDCVANTQKIEDQNEESEDGKPKSSASVFARARKLATSSNVLQLEIASPLAFSGRPSSRTFSSKSKRHSIARKKAHEDESSPVPIETSDKPTIKTTPQSTPVASRKSLCASSPATTEKMFAASLLTPNTGERRSHLHATLVATSPDTRAKKNSSTPSMENAADSDPQNLSGGVEASWKRLSRAFEKGETGGLDGYLNKLQEKDAEGADPELDGAEEILEEDGNDTAKGQNSSKFKTPKRIKQLLGINRSSNKVAPKTPTKGEVSAIDEAAMIMKELNNIILSPVQSDPPSKHKMYGGLRQVDDMSIDALSMEYPEIPSSKTTSLGDIRNFAWRRETTGKPKNTEKPRRAMSDSRRRQDAKSDKEGRSSSHRDTSLKESSRQSDNLDKLQKPQQSPRRSAHHSSRISPPDQLGQASETAFDLPIPLEGAIDYDCVAGSGPGSHNNSREENLKQQLACRRRREPRLHDKSHSRHGVSDRRVSDSNVGVAVESSSNASQRSRRCRTNLRRVCSDQATIPESRLSSRESDRSGLDDGVEGTSSRKRSDRRLDTTERSGNGFSRETDQHGRFLDHSSSLMLAEDKSAQENGKNAQPVRKESFHGTRWKRNAPRVDDNSDVPFSSHLVTASRENSETSELKEQQETGDDEEYNHLDEKQSSQHSSRRRKPSRRTIALCTGSDVPHEHSKNQQFISSSPAVESSSTMTPTSNCIGSETDDLQRSVSSRSQSRRSIRRASDKTSCKPRSQRSSLHSDSNGSDGELNASCLDKSSGLSNIREEVLLQDHPSLLVKDSEDLSNSMTARRHRSSHHRRQPASGISAKRGSAVRASPRVELSRSRSLTNMDQKPGAVNMTLTGHGSRRVARGKSEKQIQGLAESPTRTKATLARNKECDFVDVPDGDINANVQPDGVACAADDGADKIDTVADVVEDEKEDRPEKAKTAKSQHVSLDDTLERGSLLNSRLFEDDGQQTVLTDDGSVWFDQGSVAYANIRSSASVSAPQLVFGMNPNTAGGKSLGVQNV